MTPSTGETPSQSPPEMDLGTAVHHVLETSSEPLTPAKIRVRLPAPLRNVGLEELADYLNRQVTANVLIQYPKYRGQQERYWDRPPAVHVGNLLRTTLQDGPLPWSELRRKLPAYALPHAETVLHDQVAQGQLHRHPRSGKRGRERFGAAPADPKEYLRVELTAMFQRLEQLGFSRPQLRAGALELLHDEEWSPRRPETTGQPSTLEQAELHANSRDALSETP